MSNVYAPYVVPHDLGFSSTDFTTRKAETYDRRCFMEGGWQNMAAGAVRTMLTDQAALSMPLVDASHNVFRDTVVRIATRYEDAPAVKDGELGEHDAVTLFSDHQTIEQYALAYNAAIVSLRVDDGELLVDVLPPDHCDIVRNKAGRIEKLRLARPFNVRTSSADFSLEEWDLSGAQPVYRVREGGRWKEQSGYPWVYADGRPFIPVVIFRASKPPDWWGSCRWPELIEATLEEAVAWTIHRYGRVNSSSGLPYTIDAQPMGQASDGDDTGSNHVNAGPSFVLQLQSVANKQGTAGVLQATFDPEKDVEAINAAYNSRMASLGIGDTALQKGGAESGYAIVVKREGLLRLRRSTETMFRRADQEFLRKAIACTRVFSGGATESDRYRVEYAPVSMGSSENKEMRDQEKHDLDIKVATPASVLASREGIPLETAEERLATMGLGSGPKPAPTPAVAAADTGAGGAEVPQPELAEPAPTAT